MSAEVVLQHGNTRLKSCRHGPMLYLITDRFIGRALDLYGEYSEGEVKLFRQIVKPGHVALDIGANIGTHTVALARAVTADGAVFGFEPQRVVFQLLCANVALGGHTHVRTFHAAVGRTAGDVRVPLVDYGETGNFGGVELGDGDVGNDGETVPILPIDSLDLTVCHFMKIDVEGMESEVLAGAERTIGRHRPMIYTENNREEKSAALIQQLFDLDYDLHWHFPPMFNAENYFAETQNIFGNMISPNMLCVPREDARTLQNFRKVQSADDFWRPRD